MEPKTDNETRPPEVPTLAEIRSAVAQAVDALGAAEVARRLGATPETVLRLATGQPVRAGSVAIARLGLARLAPEGGT